MPSPHCFLSITDNNYIMHFAAMLDSLSGFHTEYPFFLLHTDLSEDNKKKIADYAECKSMDLRLIENKTLDLSPFTPCAHYPPCSWLKYYVGELIPDGFSRALFIDNDMIVTRPLHDLMALNMGGKPVAAVVDMQNENYPFKANLGIPASGKYFNMGLMLIDLERWAETKFGYRAARYAIENPEKITFIDQCGFNAIGWEEIEELDPTWNLMSGFVECAEHLPHVIHFAALKPWEDRRTPGREYYLRHRRNTPFPMEDQPFSEALSRAAGIARDETSHALRALLGRKLTRWWSKEDGIRYTNRKRLWKWFREDDVSRNGVAKQ